MSSGERRVPIQLSQVFNNGRYGLCRTFQNIDSISFLFLYTINSLFICTAYKGLMYSAKK